jgi:hypothetical protein
MIQICKYGQQGIGLVITPIKVSSLTEAIAKVKELNRNSTYNAIFKSERRYKSVFNSRGKKIDKIEYRVQRLVVPIERFITEYYFIKHTI